MVTRAKSEQNQAAQHNHFNHLTLPAIVSSGTDWIAEALSWVTVLLITPTQRRILQRILLKKQENLGCSELTSNWFGVFKEHSLLEKGKGGPSGTALITSCCC